MLNRQKSDYHILIAVILIITLGLACFGCGSGSNTEAKNYTSAEDINGDKIALILGSAITDYAQTNCPDSSISFYNNHADIFMAMEDGVVDTYLTDEPIARYAKNTRSIDYVKLPDFENNLAAAFPRTKEGRNLCELYNDFLKEIQDNGTLDTIETKWFSTDTAQHVMIDYTNLPDTNGVLKIGTEGCNTPFSYYENNVLVGYDIEIVALFCQKYGYKPEFEVMDLNAVVAALSTNKIDMGESCITITEERARKILFSEPNYYGALVAIYTIPEEEGFSLGGIIDSFTKTFIKEDRWKLFLKGFINTLGISFISIIAGTLLGILFLLCSGRFSNRFLRCIGRIFMKLLNRFPILVILMLLYYVILAGTNLSGTAVSIIAFTILFGCTVFRLLDIGMNSVDKNQQEAAIALGYTAHQTTFKIILPQALIMVLPLYKKEIINLIKGTAVVSYIAVQDLTKMADIIRSRTFEAFMPLISIAIMYILISLLATLLLNLLIKHLTPGNRKPEQIVKGLSATTKPLQ